MKSFKDLSIFVKLILFGVLTLVPIMLILLLKIIPDTSEKFLEEKKEKTKNLVEVAVGVVNTFYTKYEEGTLDLETAQKSAIDEVNQLRFDETNYFFGYDLEGTTIILGSDPSKFGENRIGLTDKKGNKLVQKFIEVGKDGTGFSTYYYPKLGETEASPKLSYVKLFKPWGWLVGTGLYIDDVEENLASFKNKIYIALLIALAVIGLLIFILGRAISKPLRILENAATSFSKGDNSVRVDIDSKDETGRLAGSFNSMIDSINKSMTEIEAKSREAEEAAEKAVLAQQTADNQKNYLSEKTSVLLSKMEEFMNGDLTTQVDVENQNDDVGRLFSGFNTVVTKMHQMISDVNQLVGATGNASTEISASSEQMAAGAQELSSQTHEVATAVEEMTRTIVETAQNAVNASNSSEEANSQAKEGMKKVQENLTGMEQISEATKRTGNVVTALTKKTEQIGQIAQVIDDIADQTNLLALNAAIEAARAGEQGRGFAVVADEVRKLAERTTKATKEIADTIRAIQGEAIEADKSMEEATLTVSKGMEITEQVNVALTAILGSVDSVTAEITQVATASEEQSSTSTEISQNVEGINQVAGDFANGVEHVSRAASELNTLNNNLQELVSKFKVRNDQMQLLGS